MYSTTNAHHFFEAPLYSLPSGTLSPTSILPPAVSTSKGWLVRISISQVGLIVDWYPLLLQPRRTSSGSSSNKNRSPLGATAVRKSLTAGCHTDLELLGGRSVRVLHSSRLRFVVLTLALLYVDVVEPCPESSVKRSSEHAGGDLGTTSDQGVSAFSSRSNINNVSTRGMNVCLSLRVHGAIGCGNGPTLRRAETRQRQKVARWAAPQEPAPTRPV